MIAPVNLGLCDLIIWNCLSSHANGCRVCERERTEFVKYGCLHSCTEVYVNNNYVKQAVFEFFDGLHIVDRRLACESCVFE